MGIDTDRSKGGHAGWELADDVRCWVNTVSLEHVVLGVEGGFTQADYGRSTRLSRLGAGDGIVFYSPRTAMRAGDLLQEFTALGRVGDGPVHQVSMTPDFHPWRRPVDFARVEPVPIRPLLPTLSFIPDPTRWGVVFRRGLFEIPRRDFDLIAGRMLAGDARG